MGLYYLQHVIMAVADQVMLVNRYIPKKPEPFDVVANDDLSASGIPSYHECALQSGSGRGAADYAASIK